MLGVRPLLGRLFGADEDRPGKTGKALLGHGTWMRRYGGDRNVIGRALTLNGQPYEVVGVLPRVVLAAARGHADARRGRGCGGRAAAAAGRQRGARSRNREDYNIIATLKPGVDGRAGAEPSWTR